MNDVNNKVSIPTELKQFYSNYDESFQFLQARKKRQVAQIVLMNNLQRGDENIASTMLLTLFNRILSNLYDDKMQVKFVPAEEMDAKKVNSLNILAQNDYREMDKAKLDYDWMWDTLFFGKGYMETMRFDQKRKIMEPHVINPLAFGYDPFFSDTQEWRYYWKWITKSYWELKKLIANGTITEIDDPKQIPSGIDPYLWDYKVTREQAKNATPQANDTYQGDVYQILEFYGHADRDYAKYKVERGDKCVFWIDRDFSKILWMRKLDLKDADDGKDSRWPVVVKEAFREPHSTVNFSVADLLEDKHRARSVLLNLAFIAAKDKANPIYMYNPDNVKDLSQLFSRQINQHIPVTDLTNAVSPLNTSNPMDNGLMAFMQILNQEGNDPIGTGMSLNPVKKGKQSATDTAIQQQLNDLAQSLQSKVLQFGEEQFWGDWYNRYKRYTKSGDVKLATIVGVKGMTFESIDLGDIHTKYPPKTLVFSAKEAEYKELVLRRELTQLRGDFAQNWTPDAIRNFDKHVLLPKFLQDPNIIDVLVPNTIDEIKAEQENEMINDGSKLPPVSESDNHEQHLAVHYQAKNTWSKWIHIAWHEEMLGLQKKQQQQPQLEQQSPQDQQKPGQNPGKDKKNPQEAATPLKQEMGTSIKKQNALQPK